MAEYYGIYLKKKRKRKEKKCEDGAVTWVRSCGTADRLHGRCGLAAPASRRWRRTTGGWSPSAAAIDAPACVYVRFSST